MTKVIDAEVVELVVGDLIRVQQAPIVRYELLKEFSVRITSQLEKLDLENLVASEENLQVIKSTRTELRKDLAEFEESRKNTERIILKPYKEFETEYNKLIKNPLAEADKILKKKVDNVENGLRKEKRLFFEELFEKRKVEEKLDFLNFEQIGLNIQLSTSEKSLKDKMEDFIERVKKDLAVIEVNENKNRVMVEYMRHLDLADALVVVQKAIEAEKQLEIEQNKASSEVSEPVVEVVNIKEEEVEQAPELITVSFKVTGTKEEIIQIRELMRRLDVVYE